MAKKRYYNEGMYSGMSAARAQEARDASMLNEDRSAIANMPQNVIMREYPRVDYSMGEGLNDDIRGIDRQMKADSKGKKKGAFPEKY